MVWPALDAKSSNLSKHEATQAIDVTRLALSIGHGLCSPLGTIEGSAYLIARWLEALGVDDEGAHLHIEKIRKQVRLCAIAVGGLVGFANTGDGELERVKAEASVRELAAGLAAPSRGTDP